ncbi:MAG TPA: hypothetical protein VK816_01275, partial [Jatrophihabitantaceae bacterium]|nr:hypothetical protein [Jatrophihabitantaceae bacterium]
MFDSLMTAAAPADADVAGEVLSAEVLSDEAAWLRHTAQSLVPSPVDALLDPAGTAAALAPLAPGPDVGLPLAM